MVEIKQAFVKPDFIFESVDVSKPQHVPGLDLGESPPHDPVDPVEVGSGDLEPGTPPQVGAGHYTDYLDQLWLEFDDEEERTAERMLALIDEIDDEALQIHHLSMDLFDRTPEFKLPESERERFRREFLAYLKRLRKYKTRLLDLPAESTDTDEVYLGLIKRAPKTGPVPDAIMHMYFADQLGILGEHINDMGDGFIGRVATVLDRIGTRAKDAIETIADEASGAKDELDSFWDQLRAMRWWLVGGVAAVGVLGTTAIVVTRRDAGE